MKFILYVSCVVLFFLSCNKKEKTSSNKVIEIEKVSKEINNSKEKDKKDLFVKLNEKVSDDYSLLMLDDDERLQDVLKDFMEVNKKLFKHLVSEREVIFESENLTKVYVREWVFNDLYLTKEVERVINKPYREVPINERIFLIDTIKEPYLTFRDNNKLYVFYVKTVKDASHIMYFKKILENSPLLSEAPAVRSQKAR